jgi:hypothetical protein
MAAFNPVKPVSSFELFGEVHPINEPTPTVLRKVDSLDEKANSLSDSDDVDDVVANLAELVELVSTEGLAQKIKDQWESDALTFPTLLRLVDHIKTEIIAAGND